MIIIEAEIDNSNSGVDAFFSRSWSGVRVDSSNPEWSGVRVDSSNPEWSGSEVAWIRSGVQVELELALFSISDSTLTDLMTSKRTTKNNIDTLQEMHWKREK